MKKIFLNRLVVSFYLMIAVQIFATGSSLAATAEELKTNARQALSDLYSQSPSAKALGEKAKAVVVFPAIVKGGFIIGGQYGEGVLFKGDKVAGYYNTVQASLGLQAGLQKYGYALFLMTDSAVEYLVNSKGWELGAGPTITVIDKGAAAAASTTTLRSNIYAFFFDQKGLMGGIGLQGTKISKTDK